MPTIVTCIITVQHTRNNNKLKGYSYSTATCHTGQKLSEVILMYLVVPCTKLYNVHM